MTAPIGPHARIQADIEHGEQWLTCLDCGAQWRDCEPLEQVSDGDGYCDDKASENQTHWGYGSGMRGCLFDNGPHFAETQEQAIDAALWIFQDGSESELTEEEHAQAVADLKSDGIHYFPAERRSELGASLVVVWEEQGPCPESDE
jgi:hypothetical protein